MRPELAKLLKMSPKELIMIGNQMGKTMTFMDIITGSRENTLKIITEMEAMDGPSTEPDLEGSKAPSP